ncbi:unnamed protein product, partial [Rotaria sp. Silwood2]
DEQWKNQPVLIAFIGQTGSGKSTAICRFLNKLPGKPGAPAIGKGVEECTKMSKEYTQPGTSLVYVDLPGVSSTTDVCAFDTVEQQEAYCEKFKLRTVDYFLLVSEGKINKQEKLLAEYITKKLGKKFSFMQTKVDRLRKEFGTRQDIRERGFDVVKNEIRENIRIQLDIKDTERIFLLSNDIVTAEINGEERDVYDNSPDYDFDLLMKQIQDDMFGEGGLTATKAEALILATGAVCKSAAKAKARILHRQVWGLSTLSGVIGAIPIPGVSAVCDITMIVSNAAGYFEAFGLNPFVYLGEGNPQSRLERLISIMRANMGARASALLATAVGAMAIEEGSKAIPVVGVVVGSILGASLSFASTATILRH